MNVELLIVNISKHISLTAEEIEFFTSLLKIKSLANGEFLLREGDICKYESFVIKGCVKTYYIGEDGLEHIIDFSIEEWWADDLYSLLTQTPSKTTIKAIEDTEVLQISKPDLELLYQKVPKFERFFRIIMQNAYIREQLRVIQTLSLSAEERYRIFLDKYPQVAKLVTQKQIASYLGITPEFLSMIRANKAGKTIS